MPHSRPLCLLRECQCVSDTWCSPHFPQSSWLVHQRAIAVSRIQMEPQTESWGQEGLNCKLHSHVREVTLLCLLSGHQRSTEIILRLPGYLRLSAQQEHCSLETNSSYHHALLPLTPVWSKDAWEFNDYKTPHLQPRVLHPWCLCGWRIDFSIWNSHRFSCCDFLDKALQNGQNACTLLHRRECHWKLKSWRNLWLF